MRDDLLKNQKTIVIDIENTLVTQIDLKSRSDLNQLIARENFKDTHIMVDMKMFASQGLCCLFKGSEQCICHINVYKIRPYTYDLLRAVQPFYEIICCSKNHGIVLEKIIDHIEEVINRPVIEWLEKYHNNDLNRS
jgi:hypothetical protein